MHLSPHHLALFIIVLGVAVIPFVARQLRLPSAALEIAYGAVLFNFVFQANQFEWFNLLQEIGFIYLMFIAGMELDLSALRRSGKVSWYLAIPLLSFLVTPLIFTLFGASFFLGISIAMISAGIVVPVLKESETLDTPYGQHIVYIALTGELLSILVLTLIDLFHRHGFEWAAAGALLKLVLLFGLVFIVLKLLYLMAWWHPERVEKVMESEDPVEEGIRLVVTIAIAGGVLAALAGAEPILGSFLGGMVFSQVFKNKGAFEEKINAVGFGLLIPFFFIGVGAQLDIKLLLSPASLLLATLLTLAIFISNLYPILLARPLGLTFKQGTGIAVLISAPLSMIVVAGTLGQKMGLLPPELIGTLILTALMASVVYPTIFRALAKSMHPPAAETALRYDKKGRHPG